MTYNFFCSFRWTEKYCSYITHFFTYQNWINFYKTIEYKSKFIIVIETTEGNKFGCYIDNQINEINKYISDPNAFIFKLDLDMLISGVSESVPRYKKLPQFPEVQRDLAIIVPKTTSWEDLEKVVEGLK